MSERPRHADRDLMQALDLVAERWTLLVVRALMSGPQGLADLAEWTPGLGPAPLAQRLGELESSGLIVRRQPADPARPEVYELTGIGSGLGEIVAALAQWSAEFLGWSSAQPKAHPLRILTSLSVRARMFPPVTDAEGCYNVIVGAERYHLSFSQGRPHVHSGLHPAARAVIQTTAEGLRDLVTGEISLAQALDGNVLEIDGDVPAAVDALHNLCLAAAAEARSPRSGLR